jgi:hypothetical protein
VAGSEEKEKKRGKNRKGGFLLSYSPQIDSIQFGEKKFRNSL